MKMPSRGEKSGCDASLNRLNMSNTQDMRAVRNMRSMRCEGKHATQPNVQNGKITVLIAPVVFSGKPRFNAALLHFAQLDLEPKTIEPKVSPMQASLNGSLGSRAAEQSWRDAGTVEDTQTQCGVGWHFESTGCPLGGWLWSPRLPRL